MLVQFIGIILYACKEYIEYSLEHLENNDCEFYFDTEQSALFCVADYFDYVVSVLDQYNVDYECLTI